MDAGLPGTAIRQVLQGHDPSLSRAIQIAEALDLEFDIRPSRAGNDARFDVELERLREAYRVADEFRRGEIVGALRMIARGRSAD